MPAGDIAAGKLFLGTTVARYGSRPASNEDWSMDPFTAVNQAGNYVRLAEIATDRADRENYLRAARLWLQRADVDVDTLFQPKQPPAVIIASE
jgi:hypothetical protein